MGEAKPNSAGAGIAAIIGLVLFAACSIAVAQDDNSSSSTTSTSSTATSTRERPPGEQAALDALAPACSETRDKLDAEAIKALELLQDGGVFDETVVTVLQHLRASIPESSPVMNCATVLGPYITMRTGG